jgi:XTP/dITP diphosphohydrolase
MHMGKKIWFLTGNLGKVKEAEQHLHKLGYEVEQLIIDEEILEPQSDDLYLVAQAKINQALPHLPNKEDMLLVEDAGLFIQNLNGFPGVYSAYALKTIGCNGILKLLSHLESQDPVMNGQLREAEFQAVAALWNGQEIIFGNGKCPGWISQEINGEDGFGFDPIFVPFDLDGLGNALTAGNYGETSTHGATFGAVELEKKQLFSHRTRALNDLITQL